jgi:hypothetical protein
MSASQDRARKIYNEGGSLSEKTVASVSVAENRYPSLATCR